VARNDNKKYDQTDANSGLFAFPWQQMFFKKFSKFISYGVLHFKLMYFSVILTVKIRNEWLFLKT